MALGLHYLIQGLFLGNTKIYADLANFGFAT